MGKTRDVVERFYERFGANDLDGVFACDRASERPRSCVANIALTRQ
jgi:hypothetical protein